jgi:hypothetical protein
MRGTAPKTVEGKLNPTKTNEGKGRTRSAKKEDKKNVFEEKERNSCTNTGHKYAKGVLPGGTGRGLVGHGEFRYGTTPRDFIVPRDSSLSIWSRPDTLLPDSLGRLIETGDHDKLAQLFLKNPMVQERLAGAVTHLPGAGAKMNLPGDVKIPNYTLSAPKDLIIHENSRETAHVSQ